jgi:hypothetical protein
MLPSFAWDPVFVLIPSPLLGPCSWSAVLDALDDPLDPPPQIGAAMAQKGASR